MSLLYAAYGRTPAVEALFYGVKPAVMAIVLEAVLRIGGRALNSRLDVAIAAAAFVAIFFFDVPFPVIVLGAGAAGAAGSKLGGISSSGKGSAVRGTGGEPYAEKVTPGGGPDGHAPPSITRALKVLAVWSVLWLGPLAVLAYVLGSESVFVAEGVFFSKAAVFTFGGAYSVLAYIAQETVNTYGWLMPGEMMDGLAMAETTPGPLIQVVQFVGFMGAYRNPGGLDPAAAGVLGSVLTTWFTFVPSFLWIFLGAPYIERLRDSRLLGSALSAVTAAVVGVILNLAVWFSVHTLFGEVGEVGRFGMRLIVPALNSVDPGAVFITAGAFFLIFRLRLGMIWTIGISATAGFLLKFVLGA